MELISHRNGRISSVSASVHSDRRPVTICGNDVLFLLHRLLEEADMRNAGGIHRCRIKDAFKVEDGRVVRDHETEFWRQILDSLVVNTRSGVVRIGASGTPVQWDVVQSAEPGWDFLATKSEPGNTVISTIRIRLWEDPVQLVMTMNGFTFAIGTCQALSEDPVFPAARANFTDCLAPNE